MDKNFQRMFKKSIYIFSHYEMKFRENANLNSCVISPPKFEFR